MDAEKATGTSEIPRPDTGYCLSLYDDLVQTVRDLPILIERTRGHIARQQEYLAQCEQRLAIAESTLAWMREHQADEIAEVERRRAALRATLKKAGWWKDEP